MAEEGSCRSPQSINTEESSDLQKVVVKLVIPDMAVEKKFFSTTAKPKSGEAEVDVKFDAMSLLVTAAITNKKQKPPITTQYRYKVNQLPGEIDPNKCLVEFKKEMIILNLWKTDISTWAVLLSKNGLDQAPED